MLFIPQENKVACNALLTQNFNCSPALTFSYGCLIKFFTEYGHDTGSSHMISGTVILIFICYFVDEGGFAWTKSDPIQSKNATGQ